MYAQIHDRTTLTIEEAARILGIGRTLAYDLARRGELPGVLRLGRVFRVSVPALERALAMEPTSNPSTPESV